MTDVDATALLDVTLEAAEAGAAVAARWQRRRDELHVSEKAASDDLVSQADTDTEAAVCEVLRRRRPDDAVLAEEAGDASGTTGVRWLVDPIDGTTSYLYGRADWAVSVAATDATGRLVAGAVVEPAVGRTTYASAGGGTWTAGRRVAVLRQSDLGRALVEVNLGRPDQKGHAAAMVATLVPRVRDLRRSGSAAAALAQVATGRADAAWVPGLQPWDCAAGVLLVAEAGGVVGDLRGPSAGTVPATGDVLAAPPALWEPLRRLLAGVYGRVEHRDRAHRVRPVGPGGLHVHR